MSDATMKIIPKSFPVFEANQVLSDEHLNSLRRYLEREIKSTRYKLIGTGIFEGFSFELASNKTSITIENGLGVTSSGFVIQSEFEENTFYTGIELGDDDTKPVLDNEPPGTRYFELLTDQVTANTGTRKRINFILDQEGDKGLLIYLREIDYDNKSCFTTNCDDRGKQRYYEVVPMIVIVPEGTSTAIQPTPKNLAIKRIAIPASNSPNIQSRYNAVMGVNLLNSIEQACSTLVDFYLPKFNELFKEDFTGEIPSLVDLKNGLLLNNPNSIQYFYDFVNDLTSAYNELIEQLALVNGELLYFTNTIFKTHLMLGNIPGYQNAYFGRNEFLPARRDPSDQTMLQKAYFSLKRLVLLSNSFMVPKSDALAITPSGPAMEDLGSRAIPYYYASLDQTELFRYWDFGMTKSNKDYAILSYLNYVYNRNSVEPYLSPLNYYHNHKDFLRIEGIIDRDKSVVISELVSLRKSNRLAFDIVALRVSTGGPLSDLPVNINDDADFKEHNFKDFYQENFGMEHLGGVMKGGTFIIAYETSGGSLDGPVVADFSLPYSCLCAQHEIPFSLVANDDTVSLKAKKTKDIKVLNNDQYDKHNPITLDFLYEPDAENISTSVETQTSVDIPFSATGYDPDDFEIDIEQ